MWKQFDLNTKIKVKPTPVGRRMIERNLYALNIPAELADNNYDEEGYYTMAMYYFIRVFGPYMRIGEVPDSELPFDMTVLIEDTYIGTEKNSAKSPLKATGTKKSAEAPLKVTKFGEETGTVKAPDIQKPERQTKAVKPVDTDLSIPMLLEILIKKVFSKCEYTCSDQQGGSTLTASYLLYGEQVDIKDGIAKLMHYLPSFQSVIPSIIYVRKGRNSQLPSKYKANKDILLSILEQVKEDEAIEVTITYPKEEYRDTFAFNNDTYSGAIEAFRNIIRNAPQFIAGEAKKVKFPDFFSEESEKVSIRVDSLGQVEAKIGNDKEVLTKKISETTVDLQSKPKGKLIDRPADIMDKRGKKINYICAKEVEEQILSAFRGVDISHKRKWEEDTRTLRDRYTLSIQNESDGMVYAKRLTTLLKNAGIQETIALFAYNEPMLEKVVEDKGLIFMSLDEEPDNIHVLSVTYSDITNNK